LPVLPLFTLHLIDSETFNCLGQANVKRDGKLVVYLCFCTMCKVVNLDRLGTPS